MKAGVQFNWSDRLCYFSSASAALIIITERRRRHTQSSRWLANNFFEWMSWSRLWFLCIHWTDVLIFESLPLRLSNPSTKKKKKNGDVNPASPGIRDFSKSLIQHVYWWWGHTLVFTALSAHLLPDRQSITESMLSKFSLQPVTSQSFITQPRLPLLQSNVAVWNKTVSFLWLFAPVWQQRHMEGFPKLVNWWIYFMFPSGKGRKNLEGDWLNHLSVIFNGVQSNLLLIV